MQAQTTNQYTLSCIPKIRGYCFVVLIALVIISVSSCRKDFNYVPSEGNLEFSKDTVFLDTIFSNISSNTYSLKVYNKGNEDIEIPSIQLAEGDNSTYRLNVDGRAGKAFTNIPIFAKDSLFIFIETTVDVTDTTALDFLYTDLLQFDTGVNLQEIPLVTLVKDATLLFPETLADGSTETIIIGVDASGNSIRVPGFYLKENQLRFTNEKPYVIYGYAAIPEDKELLIDAGARIHFHNDSGLFVSANAKINSNGMLSENQELLENEVIFEGDRLGATFSEIPGQWGSIWIAPGSTNNTLNFTTIKNATVALRVEGDNALQSPTLSIQNTKIYNSSSSNLWATSAAVIGENLVLGNAGGISLHCDDGGSYRFTHATIANYWSNGFRNGVALAIDNFNTVLTFPLSQANFTNCIIDGNSSIELDLQAKEEADFSYSFKNSLLKFRDDSNSFSNNPLYNFDDTNRYTNILLNQNAFFIDTANNDFNIGTMSAAKDQADLDAARNIPFDILGKSRTTTPDVGAYETLQ